MTGRRHRQPLDPRKWFDRMQPQTMQIATWLLYLNGFFALIGFMDKKPDFLLISEITGPYWVNYLKEKKCSMHFATPADSPCMH